MNELMFIFVLLLPVAWYFGYRIGRSSEPESWVRQQTALSKNYFTGLKHLLSEESDKAIDSFTSMLDDDSDTADIQLALGKLYRKRGEVLALVELGYDYMAAGLLDRAENIFLELSADLSHREACIEQLMAIYQLTKDWKKAINLAARLSSPLSDKNKVKLSHFHCELAEESLAKADQETALKSIKKAYQVYSGCVRATLITANLQISAGEYKKALRSYQDIVRQDIVFLPEAIEPIICCYSQLNNTQGLENFLKDTLQRGGGVSSILAYASLLQTKHNDRVAIEFIVSQMEKHPSLKALLRLIELHIASAPESEKQSLTMLHDVVSTLLDDKPVYHCGHCGFDSRTLFWQCPSCKSWGSVKPIKGIEGE